ncbi:MAG: ABC transporter permease [Acidobacteria bacterium]|nr:ABC transporter permease [Acidobacteriota bacterium]
MRWVGAARSLLRRLLFREEAEQRMDEEFRFHLDMETERLVRETGVDPREARRRARAKFGSVEAHKDAVRDGWAWLSGLQFGRDVRDSIRSLAKRPAFAAVAILSLALGIGANAAVFSAINSLLLRDPPFREPDRLVRVTSVRGDADGGALAVPELDDLLALPVIEDAAMYTDQGMYNASGFGTPEELQATITTHNLFRLLGIEPLVGSTFPASFDRTRSFGLVISHGLWVRKFNRDPNIVGRSMTLDGAPGYTIHGVMPPAFNFPSHSDLFRSAGIAPDPQSYRRRDVRERYVLARLAPGVGLERARDAIDDLAHRLEREFPATNAGLGFRVTPLREMYSGQIRPYVLLLFGAVALVLAVACANVANLLLSRAIARDREMAVRAALGAGRWRVIRAFLGESIVLALGGAAVGAVLALAGVRVLTRLVPVQLPPWMQIDVDVHVAAFLMSVAVLTALVTGLMPAVRIASQQPYAALKEGTRGSSEGVQHRLPRTLLVVGEVALAVVLVAGASLMLQSVWRLTSVDRGFDTANTLTFRVELGWAAYDTFEKERAFHDRVVSRFRELPGVTAVTFDDNLPMGGAPRAPVAIRVTGQGPDDEVRNPYVNHHSVGPDYFEVMDIAIRRGRAFDDRDRFDTLPTAVVSQRLADRLWPGGDPIGQRLQLESTGRPHVWWTVVGVSAPVLHHELDGEPGFELYRAQAQVGTRGPYYVIRTRGDPMIIARAATAIVGETDPNQSFLDVQTYDRRVENRIWQRRLAGALFGSFAALALVLAAVGLYGVLSYIVSHQTRDIGVRRALGATSDGIVREILARGLRPAIAGIVLGLVLVVAFGRLIAGMLYAVSPVDPLTLVLAPTLLLAIAALACYVPARRATRVDPIVALRTE